MKVMNFYRKVVEQKTKIKNKKVLKRNESS